MLGFDVEHDCFRKNLARIMENVQLLGEDSVENKSKDWECFRRKEWLALVDVKRGRHSLFECRECLSKEKFRVCLCLFPIDKKNLKGMKRAKEAGLYKKKACEIREKAREVLTELNVEFEQVLDAVSKRQH